MALHDIEVTTLDGHTTTLGEWAGKVLLVVNVASRCGFTPQYAGLQQLQDRYADDGLVVLGFPCNQFLFQEPGGPEAIRACGLEYGVSFPIMEKVSVRGRKKHPLYAELLATGGGPVRWNFEKFLVSRTGEVLGRFRSATEPTSADLIEAVEQALAV